MFHHAGQIGGGPRVRNVGDLLAVSSCTARLALRRSPG